MRVSGFEAETLPEAGERVSQDALVLAVQANVFGPPAEMSMYRVLLGV
jgi:hypothetical protein